MTEYRRNRVAGGTYFFTLVTYARNPLFINQAARGILLEAWEFVCSKHPFKTDSICLLPDHLHTIWILPEGDADYSTRWKEIKRRFSHHFKDVCPDLTIQHDSMRDKMELPFWQRRFWEHTIRDDSDLEEHRNYIHFNPVKHGFVNKPVDWEWSSIHRFIQNRVYDTDWGDQGMSNPSNGVPHEFE